MIKRVLVLTLLFACAKSQPGGSRFDIADRAEGAGNDRWLQALHPSR